MIGAGDVLVDSHVHFWQRDRFAYRWLDGEGGALQRDFMPVDLVADLAAPDAVPLSACVFVQADCRADQSVDEARWVQELATSGAPVLAIVAHAPLELGGACADRLDELLHAADLVSGVRRLLQDEPAGFASSPAFVEGVRQLGPRGLSMDLCVRQHQLPEVTELVGLCPEVLFVLDHCGKPRLTDSGFDQWAADLARLASHPHVRCKLSGLATEAPADARAGLSLRPWLERALELFGPERCMFGSDWPVLTSATTYRDWYDVVLHAIDDLTDTEKGGVMGGVALATYDPDNRAARAKEGGPWP